MKVSFVATSSLASSSAGSGQALFRAFLELPLLESDALQTDACLLKQELNQPLPQGGVAEMLANEVVTAVQ